jgi:hypothetical protein
MGEFKLSTHTININWLEMYTSQHGITKPTTLSEVSRGFFSPFKDLAFMLMPLESLEKGKTVPFYSLFH